MSLFVPTTLSTTGDTVVLTAENVLDVAKELNERRQGWFVIYRPDGVIQLRNVAINATHNIGTRISSIGKKIDPKYTVTEQGEPANAEPTEYRVDIRTVTTETQAYIIDAKDFHQAYGMELKNANENDLICAVIDEVASVTTSSKISDEEMRVTNFEPIT